MLVTAMQPFLERRVAFHFRFPQTGLLLHGYPVAWMSLHLSLATAEAVPGPCTAFKLSQGLIAQLNR